MFPGSDDDLGMEDMDTDGQLENTETREWKWEWKQEWKQPERCGERKPVAWPYSRQESQISHELTTGIWQYSHLSFLLA